MRALAGPVASLIGVMLGVLAGAASAIDCPPYPPVPPRPVPAKLVVSSGLAPSGSKDRIRITVYDRINGLTSTPVALADSVQTTRLNKAIVISAVLLDPCTPANSIGPFDVDLGSLGPGLYTVTYSSGQFYGNQAVLKFAVADSGAATEWPSVPAVEYFHADLDRYFITADPREIAVLDEGTIRGWARTGEHFPVFPADGIPGDYSGPVCRLYGLPEAGLDSHFYSIDPDECAVVLERWPSSWTLEASAVFGAGYAFGFVDESGAIVHYCDPGQPLFRLYSNGAGSDHRYTMSREVRDGMIARGWIAEGQYRAADGLPFAMCVPAER